MPVVVVDIEVVDDGEEEDEEEEVEQGSLQGSWGGIEVEEKLLVELDPVELLTSLYGKTPRIGAVVVESAGKDAVNILMHTQTKPIYKFGLVFLSTCQMGGVILVELREKPCLLILILDSVVVGNSWQGEHDSKEIEQ